MTTAALFGALALPPLLLVLMGLGGVAAAWRGWRPGLLVAAIAGTGQLVLATPVAAGLLLASLHLPPAPDVVPGAIVVLGADAARAAGRTEVGPLTLERLRAGAALHRRTGLPLLVTAGPNAPGEEPLGYAMARSLAEDFGTPARWTEAAARDTRDNAVLGTARLRQDGITAAHLVTHAWHMPRAAAAFARAGLPVVPAPLRPDRLPGGGAGDWLPRADHLAGSWFALREWAGRLVYALRD